jgi:hypothetical protein
MMVLRTVKSTNEEGEVVNIVIVTSRTGELKNYRNQIVIKYYSTT